MANAIRRHRVISAVIAIAGAAAFASPAAASAPRHAPKHRLAAGTSTNWSGYALDGTGATQVSGSWVVQPATCAPKETSWSSPWVGIDGDTNSTVEQTGTDSDCSRGAPSYYAWWEMYPKSAVIINHPVSPGDTMTGSVTYGSSGFTLTLTDAGKWTFSTVQTSSKAQRSSVEWIVEGPSNGSLTDFGQLTFSSASAAISGQSGLLGSFGSPQMITMVTRKGTTRAAPGQISPDGTFTDIWQHA